MKGPTSLLDRMTAMRLLQHGVFLSNKTPPITNHQALLLLAEAVLNNFVKEFKGIVKELLSGSCLDDFQATAIEIQSWLGQEPDTVQQNEQPQQADKECPPNSGDTTPRSCSHSNTCKEVDEKMKFDMQSKLDEYLRLLDQIKQKTTDERTAVSLLQELSRDRRSAEIREERESRNSDDSNNNSIPATDKQQQFMKKLGIKFPATVTKQEASLMIDEELGKNSE